MEGGLISDGAIAQDINQASSFWQIREVRLLQFIFLVYIFFQNFCYHVSVVFL